MSAPPTPPPPMKGPPPPPTSKFPNKKLPTVAAASGGGGGSLSDLLAKKRIEPTSTSEPVSGTTGYTYFQEKSKTGFVGLSNQGATCYLNSLIQTLFMTPEFKYALFNWMYDPINDGPEASCIPLQLQRLFGLLQDGNAAVQETKQLTLSFGWGATDAFRQHDVQELLRKLFEAMEITFKHGNLQDTKASPVNLLYEGVLKDYIRCLESEQQQQHERVRYDPFMDLLLSIRGVDSLQSALDLYTEEEILDEGNKWQCDTCGTKVKAAKGLRLKSTPLFLTLQLKRFDYDYTTWQRIKLNNRVTFPMELDVRKWLTEDTDNKVTNYELFSVLIHQGGAQGGHYYAMIKDILTGKWYKFNDASVMEIDAKDVELMYGEKPAGEEDSESKKSTSIVRNKLFSTNAYLLLYRRKGPDPLPVPRPLPEYIQKMVQQENEKFAKAKEEYIQRRDNLPLDLYFKDTVLKLHIDKNKTLKDALIQSFALAGLTGSQYSLDCVRLRKFNPETGTLGRVWKSEEDCTQKTLDQLGIIKTSILKLEIREPNESFPEDSGEFKLQVVLAVDGKFQEPIHVVVPSRETTIGQFKKVLESALGWPSDTIRIVKVNPDASSKIFTEEEEIKELQKDIGLVDGNSIHVEQIKHKDDPSTVVALFEEAASMIQVFFNKPDDRESNIDILISKKNTLAQLRDQISVHLGCEPNQFQICRSALGNQFKDESLSLEELGIYDGHSLHLKPGEPLLPNHVKINFVTYDRERDTFTPLTQSHSVSQDLPISEIRKLVAQELGSTHELEVSHIRLRGQHGKKAGPILFDESTLKQSIPNLTDHQTIAVQILDKPEFVKPNQVLLQVHRWFPSKQELQEKGSDVVLPVGSNILSLRKHLASLQSEIEMLEHIALARPYSYQLKNKNTLSTLLKWDIDPETELHDGDLILYKDIRDPEVEFEGYRSPRGSISQKKEPGMNRPLEVGIQIHTMYDEEGRAKFAYLLGKKSEQQQEDQKEQTVSTKSPEDQNQPSTKE